MAGHSKWANIRHRKGAQDAKRGKIFTKLIREITISAKLGGGDIASNPRLRIAVDKALGANMTRDTIDRAVKRGAGGDDGVDLAELRYEGYGPGGVAVMVDCLTDNKNRTVAEVRHAFTKAGGNLGQDGSVAYLFTKQGKIYFDAGLDEDKLMEAAIDAGADDVDSNGEDGFEVTTAPENYEGVLTALAAAKFKPANSELSMVASTDIEIEHEVGEKLLRLIDRLEDLDDVQDVYFNASIPDSVLDNL